MRSQLKAWLAAATVLLLVGGGCAQTATVDTGAGAGMPVPPESAMMEKGDDVDAAVDAYLEASTEEQAAASAEDKDAELLNTTDAELNAYGTTYDKSELQ